jgi:hypothetical protein
MDKFLRRQGLANGHEVLVGGMYSGGLHPRGDLSNGYVFQLRLELQEGRIRFAGIFFVYLEGLRLEVNG